MTTISSTPKVGYIYDADSDTWYPLTAGLASSSADYAWTGDHNFSSSVSFNSVVSAKAGINNFQNAAARDAAIPTPSNGVVCFIREDSSGNAINQLFYYSITASRWISVSDTQILSKTATYELGLSNSGKTITLNSASNTYLDIPSNSRVAFPVGSRLEVIRLGSGEVEFREGSGVTIRSKNSNKKLSLPNTGATVIKIDTNEWLIIGDLKA